MRKMLLLALCVIAILAPCLVGGCDAPAKVREEHRCRDCGARIGSLPTPGAVPAKGVEDVR